MFFTAEQITSSISALSKVHPFYGITFLACKKAGLPIGEKIEFPLDSVTASFLRKFHRLDPTSECFFQPFTVAAKKWVRPDYAASGLQAINTQTFGSAFLHQRGTRIWGWASDYVSTLASKLSKNKRIPAFHLAIWLYKDKDWPVGSNAEDIIDLFIKDFHITGEEIQTLFDVIMPSFSIDNIFQQNKVSWYDLRPFIPAAPDAKPDQGGTLAYLETRGLGPALRLRLEPASRLTLITGDNGLGKTFLLECAWWALTGFWADRPAYPNPGVGKNMASITFAIEGEHAKPDKKTISFDWKTLAWPQTKKRPTIPGLIVYARVDGSFAVWDPAKQMTAISDPVRINRSVFTCAEVWDGLQGRIEGLIRDWIRWQSNPLKYPFETFIKVLERLSPPDLGRLEPGESIRIPDDPREIPTIRHPYGVTPIVYASAGVKRIITLAYLIVWAWNEHVIAAELARTEPQRRMVVLVDEMEAHLHPRWQRAVLPALTSIGEMLAPELEAQFIVATHSPLVMASAETIFNQEIDALFHLDLSDTGDVSLREVDFVKFGDVSSWLTSPVFELRHARSSQAEAAIETAKALQMRQDVSASEVHDISASLIKYLAPDDKFWPRWVSYAERFGVEL